MNNNRALYVGIIVVGIIIVLVGIFAHQLGLGSAGFGIKKLIAIVVGVIVVAVGLWGTMRGT